MSEFDAPRELLVRANFGERAAVAEDGRTMTGYPVVFNTWTEINTYEGRFLEQIAPSALRKTMRENGDSVKVLFNHGMDPQIGKKPLGKPTVMRSDDKGLYVEVPLDDTSYNADLLASMRSGAIDGMSFQFSVADETWEEPAKKGGLPKRTVTQLRLYEFGPVTFPAYQATSVGIRSHEDFAEWRCLDDSKRAEIARIMGISTDLRTAFDSAALSTDDDTAAANDDLEPLGAHSGVTHKHRAAVARARLVGAMQ